VIQERQEAAGRRGAVRQAQGRRLVVAKDETGLDKIGFEFLEGVAIPKPEKLPGSRKRSAPRKPKGGPGDDKPTKPLVKA
jgi:ATP-dependent Clp protease ATP-binding subunit ClpA